MFCDVVPRLALNFSLSRVFYSFFINPEPPSSCGYIAKEKGLSLSIRLIAYDHFRFMKEVYRYTD